MMNTNHHIDTQLFLRSSQVLDVMGMIPIEIEFGVLGINNCKNFGICRIVRHTALDNSYISPSPCKQGQGYLFWRSETTVQLSLLWSSMSACTQEKYFAHGQFIVEQDFWLPDTVCPDQAMNTYVIPKGQYEAMKNTVFVHLLFNIRYFSSI